MAKWKTRTLSAWPDRHVKAELECSAEDLAQSVADRWNAGHSVRDTCPACGQIRGRGDNHKHGCTLVHFNAMYAEATGRNLL